MKILIYFAGMERRVKKAIEVRFMLHYQPKESTWKLSSPKYNTHLFTNLYFNNLQRKFITCRKAARSVPESEQCVYVGMRNQFGNSCEF